MNLKNCWKKLTRQGNGHYTATITENQLSIVLSPKPLARRALQALRTAQHVTLDLAPGRIRLSSHGANPDIQLEIPLCMSIEISTSGFQCALLSEDGEEVRRPVHTLRFFTHGLPREMDAPARPPAPS